MTRRSVTLFAAGALIVVLVAVAALLPVPYIVYSPGPLENTLGEWDGEPVVQVEEGVDTYDPDGELDLTTVGVTSADARLDLLTVLRAWFDGDRAVVPRSSVYQEGETTEEAREQNALQLARSQESAKVAALRELGHNVPERVMVVTVYDDTPASGVLEPGDVIVSVDGTEVDEPEQVAEVVTDREAGDTVDMVVRREGDELPVTVETTAADDGRPIIGIGADWGYQLPFDVDIAIDERIGGPSAGMIFALAIYDTLTEEPLVEGKHIAGTGEITGDGDIGPIGGIQQKIVAAEQVGVGLFLAPAENCADAAAADNGEMLVTPVDTFTDAIDAVETYTAGNGEDLQVCE